MYQTHPIPPLYNSESKVLILGSFPSVKSRKIAFFYGHPQNRFWKVISSLVNSPLPQTQQEKTDLILNNKLALWDVIGGCEITGSSDTSIKNVKPNDIGEILANSKVDRIFVNGKTAEKYYIWYIEPVIGKKAVCLPSTSPANAAWSVDRLISAWAQIFE